MSFRGSAAEVLLPPTSSIELAARRLASLPTGGRTPVDAGLARARAVLAAESIRDPRRRPLLVVITDGRANATGNLDRAPTVSLDPVASALAEARALASTGVGAIVIDTEDAAVRLGLASELARALGAPCIALEALAAQPLAGLVRAVTGTTTSGIATGAGRRRRRIA